MTGVAIALASGCVFAAAVASSLRRRLLIVTVSGTSMEPTLRDGDRVLVRRKPVEKVRRGEIVVMAVEWAGGTRAGQLGECRVKRVAALPGDAVPEDVVRILGLEPGATVPAGGLVLLGDNAGESFDSRQGGFFRADRLVGVVLREVNRARRAAPRPVRDGPPR